MPDLTFPRSGAPPLVADCVVIARESSQKPDRSLSEYWHEITLGRTPAGRYVIGIEYKSSRRGEPGHSWALVCERAEDVPPALESYDPIEWVIGWPAGEQFQDRQQQLLTAIQAGYYSAVGRVLAAVEDFAERVE
jgi:hypothetical protein